ncbi:MAG: Holliday junction resolvase RuvX [Schaalia hyovaginalis]|uniref:Holliday junction resolvase RuvX n=1 Tax=Schaalia hyovaginalis TaxID=29316 RepID=UPI0026EB0AB8|nr:Holliday junction resolvase RuvX [Schaalia hyovaginalis]MCI6412014.1 Holliday junction resolvase RuvX [Schaalia hyovaginalis]MDY6213448.1 Holliday junction resolvase RuvX [Schaalia hyovaginalis]
MTLRRGVRLGVDVGTVRVGVSRSDPEGILAVPLETVLRRDDWSDIDDICRIIDAFDAFEVIVGLPRHLKGGEGVSAKGARRYARRIKAKRPGVRVALIDERLSSNQAHARLRQSGIPEKEHRPVIDQVAAQIILELALDEERMSGRAPGIEITKEGNDRS